MLLRIQWLIVATSVLPLTGCGGRAVTEKAAAPKESARNFNRVESERRDPGQRATQSAGTSEIGDRPSAIRSRSEFVPLDLSFVHEDVYAALIIRPSRIVNSPTWKRLFGELLNELSIDLPVDPMQLEYLAMFLSPLTDEAMAQLRGDPADEKADPIPSKPFTPAEMGLKPDEKPPELDHLFAGLTPEQEFKPYSPPRQSTSADLSQLIPPFISLVVRFSDATNAKSFVDRLDKMYFFDEFERAGRKYFKQGLTYRSDQKHLLALHVANDQTVVMAFEDTLTKMLSTAGEKTPLLERMRKLESAKHEMFGVLTMEPVRDMLNELAEIKSLNDFRFSNVIDRLSAVTVFLETEGRELINLRAEGNSPDAIQDVGRQIDEWISTSSQLARSTIQQWSNNNERQAIVSLTNKVLDGLRVGVEDDSVDVRLNSLESYSKSLEPVITYARSQLERKHRQVYLEQIGLAMLSYYDVNGRYPDNSPYGLSKHPVSWRVKLLPYMDHGDLFDQYEFDEPWNSKRNQKVIEQMPRQFGPGGSETSIMTLTGPGTTFTGQRIRFDDIVDGTGKTIFAVRAAPDKSVPWTKPADVTWDNEDPLSGLGKTALTDGFEVIFFDGSFANLPYNIGRESLRSLVHPSDGMPADVDF